jgi:hypothetical protein
MTSAAFLDYLAIDSIAAQTGSQRGSVGKFRQYLSVTHRNAPSRRVPVYLGPVFRFISISRWGLRLLVHLSRFHR